MRRDENAKNNTLEDIMKNAMLTFVVLLSLGVSTSAYAKVSVQAHVIVGTTDKFADNSFRVVAPNGTDAAAIDCSQDKFSTIEVNEQEHGYWVHYGFKSHKECLRAAKAAEKATSKYPAVIVLINGIPTLAL